MFYSATNNENVNLSSFFSKIVDDLNLITLKNLKPTEQIKIFYKYLKSDINDIEEKVKSINGFKEYFSNISDKDFNLSTCTKNVEKIKKLEAIEKE